MKRQVTEQPVSTQLRTPISRAKPKIVMEPPSESFQSDFVQNNQSRQSMDIDVTSGTTTPRRKGNPKSSSSRFSASKGDGDGDRDGVSPEEKTTGAVSIQPLTPLSTISALLKASHSHSTTMLQLYRQSQTLQRQTNERLASALEKLRQAQGEVEHATTAQECANEELERVAAQKQEVDETLKATQKQTLVLSKPLVGKRVRLVRLTKNVHWNGRSGTIVELVADGHDVARWKVKLDVEWRGRDAEGRKILRSDTVSEHDYNESNTVVAKAENLEIVGDERVYDVTETLLQGTRSKARSHSKDQGGRVSKPRARRAVDPEQEDFLHTALSAKDPDSSSMNHRQAVQVTPDSSPQKNRSLEQPYRNPSRERNGKHGHPSQHSPREPSSNSIRENRHHSRGHVQLTPEPNHLSSAFSNMFMSPISFTPASFEPMPSESFGRYVQESMERRENGAIGRRDGSSTHPDRHFANLSDSRDIVSVAGSFFDEVTSFERNAFIANDDDQSSQVNMPCNGYYTSPQETQTALDDGGESSLPSIVVLPVSEDDRNVPFIPNQPPHCVGVQGAAVSHVNGVYLLAYPKDEDGRPLLEEEVPPLYFRNAPPITINDREYDLCILRITCPDSSDHVIWFIAKVDVDPSCLDVKFRDCYYYCRLLSNDDGRGGEMEEGLSNNIPPSAGWNVPRLPANCSEVLPSPGMSRYSL